MASKRSYRNGLKSLLVGLLLLLILIVLPIMLLAKRKRKQSWEQLIIQSPYRLIADYIIAQAKHESANLTSNLFLNANNLFGFKTYSVTRFRVPENERGEGQPNYYMQFSNPEESADYMIQWLMRHKIPPEPQTLERYVGRLHSARFFTDNPANYVKGVKRFL